MNPKKDQDFALIQGSFGGLLAGVGFLYGGIFLMPISIAFLWSCSRFPLAGALWGGMAVLLSHCWLLSLHPLMWIGISKFLSLFTAIAIWLFCGLLGGFFVWSWCLVGQAILRSFPNKNQLFLKVCWALIMALLWGLAEVLLAQTPLFWIGISSSMLPGDRILAGIARWIGAGGLGAFEMLIGWWIWQLGLSFKKGLRWRRLLFVGLLIVFLAHLVGWILLLKPLSSNSKSIALWQPAIPTREKFSNEKIKKLPSQIKEKLDVSKDLGALWMLAPEGLLQSNQELIAPTPIPFLTGGFRWVNGKQRSSLLVFDTSNRTHKKFLDKHRLVPLGEWMPNLPGFSSSGLSAIGGLEPGESSRLLLWNGQPFAGAICYEISDGSAIARAVMGGAEWILAIANLDPYPISLQKQFLAMAQLRSIETARDLISVANTGPSSMVTSTGKTYQVLPPFIEGLGLSTIHMSREKTLYVKWGETPLVVLLTASFFVLYGSRIKRY